MEINEAWDKIWEKIPVSARPKDSVESAKIITIACSIISFALSEAGIKNVLDDIAFIGLDMQVVSKPLYEPMSTQNDGAEDSKPAKKSKKGGSEETVTDDDSKSA